MVFRIRTPVQSFSVNGFNSFSIVFPDRLRHQFAGLFHKITILGQLQNILTVEIFSGIPALIIDAFYFSLPDENQNFINLKTQQHRHLIDCDPCRQPAALK